MGLNSSDHGRFCHEETAEAGRWAADFTGGRRTIRCNGSFPRKRSPDAGDDFPQQTPLSITSSARPSSVEIDHQLKFGWKTRCGPGLFEQT
jgi:hypothetical protein